MVHYCLSVVLQLPRISAIRPEVAIHAIKLHGPTSADSKIYKKLKMDLADVKAAIQILSRCMAKLVRK